MHVSIHQDRDQALHATARAGSQRARSTSSATRARRRATPSRCSRGAERRRRHRPAAREGAATARRSSAPAAPSADSATPTAPSSSSTTTPTWRAPATPTASTSARTTCRSPRPARLAGPDAIVGLSTHSEEQIDAACAAEGDGRPDYISVGPIWETPTKEGRPAVGLELVEHAAASARRSLLRDRRHRPGNADEVIAAGATPGGRRARDPRRRRPEAAARHLPTHSQRWRESAAAPWVAASESAPRARSARRGARHDAKALRRRQSRISPSPRTAPARTWSARESARSAKPRGARGARAAGRGRAAAGGHVGAVICGADRRSRSSPATSLWDVLGRSDEPRRAGIRRRRLHRPLRDDGLGHVAGPLLGGARLPGCCSCSCSSQRARPRSRRPRRCPGARHASSCSPSPAPSSSSWSRRWRGSRCPTPRRPAMTLG